MHYLKLQWSHGQQDLVDDGFHDAMAFTDAALQRSEGVLIQYVAFCHTLSVFHPPSAANVAFLVLQPWLSPLS
jgi:hypothetical protein